ncbi:MAG: ABC transporter ATP-binding protein [Acidimicrobiaceae bacterium]|nr:ABC transporter ATP-binding protein [Acidimicrobiaceae bacterium]
MEPVSTTPAVAATGEAGLDDRLASDGPAIEAVGLTKRYGASTAVDELTLSVGRGEVFGLLGPNGAGKTTTILMLLGLTEPTAGTASVDGLDPSRDPLAVKARVGYVPDEVGFYDDLTALENLRYTCRLNRIERREAERRIDEALDDVGLLDVASRPVGTYSRGMRQRLGLADALVKRPKILILDEPTVNIDPEGVRELLLLVERLRTDQGVTVLLSSHLLHQVQQVCDRIGIFVRGRLRACGTVDELADELDDRWVFDIGVADIDQPRDLLERLPGVSGCTRSEGRWLVHADHDIRIDLHRAVVAAGGRLFHLARREADLDAIYHRYFEGGERELEHTIS